MLGENHVKWLLPETKDSIILSTMRFLDLSSRIQRGLAESRNYTKAEAYDYMREQAIKVEVKIAGIMQKRFLPGLDAKKSIERFKACEKKGGKP